MNPAITIRKETDADIRTITEVTVAAFKTLKISNQTEQFIIEALRAAKALTLSLVAKKNKGESMSVNEMPLVSCFTSHKMNL